MSTVSIDVEAMLHACTQFDPPRTSYELANRIRSYALKAAQEQKSIASAGPDYCGECYGTGHRPNVPTQACPACGGTGDGE